MVASADFFKTEDTDRIWWLDMPNETGPLVFSFDKKKLFNFWTDYPDKLTAEQRAVFDAENPELVALK